MLAQIKEICIITTPESSEQFKMLLGKGEKWGIKLEYVEQPKREGIAQAYIIAEKFLSGDPSFLVLGDNIFFGSELSSMLIGCKELTGKATIFGYEVNDPERYGVLSFDKNGSVKSIKEKPSKPESNFAITGLYSFPGDASYRAKSLEPSARGELEIVSLIEKYLIDGLLDVKIFNRGFAWLDTGTSDSLLDASNFVRTLQIRQGFSVGCPEEIAYKNGWISSEDLMELAYEYQAADYGKYLARLIKGEKD